VIYDVFFISYAQMAGQIIRERGVFGLYRGFSATLLRDVPSVGFYFGMFYDPFDVIYDVF